MKVSFAPATYGFKADALCIFVAGGKIGRAASAGLEKSVAHAAAQAVRGQLAGGKAGRAAAVSTLGKMPAQTVVLAGAGKEPGADGLRTAAAAAIKLSMQMGLARIAAALPDSSACPPVQAASQIVEGAVLASYSFDSYKSVKGPAAPSLVLLSDAKAVGQAAKAARASALGAVFARSLANMPPNECTPAVLASKARSIASSSGALRCTVTGKAELKKRGFGGITAVGGGSANGPRLVVLEYRGAARSKRPVALVGKAVTFDTGGISLKPGEKMEEMKFDKCGGCTVLGIMQAAAAMKIRQNIIGIVPSVENMPGGRAYRPGDIVRLYGGRTAEIINTDAEGRLILHDAMAYAERRFAPAEIIDFATLTGACIVALGANVAGMVSNDAALASRLAESSARTGEQVWQLPIGEEYMEMIDSKVADMKNMGIGRTAGTIAAAAFLRRAIRETPWAHFDIAGTAWTQVGTKERPYNPPGATGFGVRLVLDYLQKRR